MEINKEYRVKWFIQNRMFNRDIPNIIHTQNKNKNLLTGTVLTLLTKLKKIYDNAVAKCLIF